MINIAFFHQHFLVQTEGISALKRLPGVRVVVIEIPDHPSEMQSRSACAALYGQKCSVLFTINDWGLDDESVIAAYCKKNAIIQVNWCVDDPFFSETMFGRALCPAPNRIDFVSDRAYVPDMRKRGLNAHFLALAADPTIFFPDSAPPDYKRDLCFVGNSYRKQIEEFCTQCEGLMERLVPFMAGILNRYEKNMLIDIGQEVSNELDHCELPAPLSKQKALFIIKHFISYLFRKKIIRNLSHEFSDFMAFGDALWVMDLPKEKVSTAVGYYTNLRETYRETRVNLDINRIVITEGLTQRVFDCLACGAFIITNNKPIINEFFVVDGPEKELVTFNNEQHLNRLIKHYIKHESERNDIIYRGQRRVLLEHTYDHRIQNLFKILSEHLNGPMRS
jgi:spore maturation protein CgeB